MMFSDMLLWGVLCLLGLQTIPTFWHLRCYTVISGSMAPGIPVGSLIYVKKIDFEDIREHDVITYATRNGKMTVTHRVEQVNSARRTLITKGDANNAEDPTPVQEGQIHGIVVRCIPFLGYCYTGLNGKKGGILLFLLIEGTAIVWKNGDAERNDKEKKEKAAPRGSARSADSGCDGNHDDGLSQK